jgi:hypothetical protein
MFFALWGAAASLISEARVQRAGVRDDPTHLAACARAFMEMRNSSASLAMIEGSSSSSMAGRRAGRSNTAPRRGWISPGRCSPIVRGLASRGAQPHDRDQPHC